MLNQELNRLELNSYNYLRQSLQYKDNLIIARTKIDNQQDNNLIAFTIEDKNLNTDLCFWQLSMRKSITKYFTLIKGENKVILIRK
jgi:hypothetical protein